MISPAVILSEYLIDQGLFTAPSDEDSWPLYISSVPDADTVENDLGGIYDSEGLKDGRIMSSGETIFHYGFQVRVRSEDYQDGWDKLHEVNELLVAVTNEVVTVASVDYLVESISQISSIMSLGVEEGTKRRYNFTVNFLATIKEN